MEAQPHSGPDCLGHSVVRQCVHQRSPGRGDFTTHHGLKPRVSIGRTAVSIWHPKCFEDTEEICLLTSIECAKRGPQYPTLQADILQTRLQHAYWRESAASSQHVFDKRV